MTPSRGSFALIGLGATGVVACLDVLEFFRAGGKLSWSEFPGMNFLLGLAGAAALVLFGKLVLGPLLARDPGYYE